MIVNGQPPVGQNGALPPTGYSLVKDTIVAIALSAIAIFGAALVSHSAPQFSAVLLAVPFVAFVVWLVRRLPHETRTTVLPWHWSVFRPRSTVVVPGGVTVHSASPRGWGVRLWNGFRSGWNHLSVLPATRGSNSPRSLRLSRGGSPVHPPGPQGMHPRQGSRTPGPQQGMSALPGNRGGGANPSRQGGGSTHMFPLGTNR